MHFLVQVLRATSGVMGGVRNGRTRTCTGDPCYIPRLGTVPVPPGGAGEVGASIRASRRAATDTSRCRRSLS